MGSWQSKIGWHQGTRTVHGLWMSVSLPLAENEKRKTICNPFFKFYTKTKNEKRKRKLKSVFSKVTKKKNGERKVNSNSVPSRRGKNAKRKFRCFAAKESENKICASFSYAIDSKFLPKTNFRVIGTLNKDQKSNDCSVSNRTNTECINLHYSCLLINAWNALTIPNKRYCQKWTRDDISTDNTILL